ncbi:MAG TPA: hypothetical protein VF533_22480 [Solirubrobacteraceae bacterium]|jgi:hypothetical protein
MANVLVLANQTIGGKALLDAVRERNAAGDAKFFVVVPQNRPAHGNVIYDEAVRDAAQVRVDLALGFMREEGFEGTGEVGDSDPYNAAKDAIAAHRIDEVILSTLPITSSGWLRRDLPERIEQDTGVPVHHVVTDIGREGLPFDVCLVVANQTVAGDELVERMKAKAEEGPRRFIVAVPQESGDGAACSAARGRLRQLLDSLADSGIVAAGFIADPDPYTATMNAVQTFLISEILISTLPSNRSAWTSKGLIEKVANATRKPVEHVEVSVGDRVGA